MADRLYDVRAENGRIYTVRAPEGTSERKLFAAVQEQIYKEEDEALAKRREELLNAPRYEAPESTTALGNILRGVPAGAINLLESAALGAITPLGEETEKSARDVIKSVADAVRPRLANPEEVTAKLAQGVGSILGFAPALLAGPAAPALAAGLGAASGAGEASERARAKDATQEERNRAALLGVAPGLLDVLPLGRFARAAGFDVGDIPVIGEMINKLGPEAVEGMRSRVERALISGGIEGAQEAAQNIAQNLIEQGYSPETPTFGGTLEEGLIGGGAGAIFQGLIDLVVGRRQRGPSAPTAPEQGELFPGADLGTTPPPLGPEQGELFPTEGLGRAPEQDAQLDLFGPRASQAAALRQRIRDLELERQRIIRSPMAPFEEAGDPFLERTKAEIDQARAQLAELEGRVEPEQIDFTPQLERSIQEQELAAARDRAGLAAAARGDVEAFEQPDLFPAAAETAREVAAVRRLGQRAKPEAVAEPAPQPGPRQYELEDAIELQRMIDEEAAATRAQETAARELSAASDLETIAGQLGTQQEQETARRRGEVLDSVLSGLSTASRANTARRFSAALADAGIANTAPTAAELRTIARATDAVAARPAVEEAAPEVVTGPPEATQLEEMEARIPERRTAPRAPEQPSFPGMGRRGTAPAVPAEPAPEPRILGEAELDRLQIPKTAPIRKRIIGKDFNDPAIRKQLIDFANNPRTSEIARFNIDRLVRNVPEEQGDLFAPRRGGQRRTAAEPRDVQTEAAAAPKTEAVGEQLSLFGDTISYRDIDAARRRASVSSTVRRGRDTPSDTTSEAPLSDAGGLGTAASDAKRVVEGERGKRTPLTPASKSKPKAAKKPVTEKKEAPKRAFTGQKRTEAEIADLEKRTPGGVMLEVNKQRLRTGRYNVEEIADQRDPFTAKDKAIISELEAEGTTTRDLNGQSFLAYMKLGNPIQGLYSAIYDVVNETPQFTGREKGLSEKLSAMYRGTGKASAERALRWAEDNLSPELNAWITKEEARVIKASEESTLGLIDKINAENAAKSELNQRVQAQIEREEAEATREQNRKDAKKLRDLNKLLLVADAVAGLGLPVHPAVSSAVRDGDLSGALNVLAMTSQDKRVAQIARKMAQVVGNTKVEVVNNLKGADGTPAAGLFDPKTNTIKLDATNGINPHTLLHEVTHAAVSATLANKNSPVTKQLTKLFDDVKGRLENHYGATSVDEFVSEVFSNPEFQAELAQLDIDGKPVSALQRFMNIVSNFVRRMLGMQVKPLGSALNAADTLIESILAPAPQSRSANELFMASKFGNYKQVLDSALDNVPPMTKDGAKRMMDFIRDRNIGAAVKEGLMLLTPLHAAVELASPYFPSAAKLNDIVRRQSGAINKGAEAIDGVVKQVSKWGSANPEKMDTLNELITLSTTEQVDPELNATQAQNKYGSDPERMRAWRDAKRMFNEIGDGGRTQYRTMRNTYKSLFKDIKRVLQKRIREEVGGDQGKAIYDEINKRLMENGVIDPYFPLFRRGNYWLSYNAINPRTKQMDFFVEAFDSASGRRDAIAALKADPNSGVQANSINEYSNRSQTNYKNAPPTSFVNDVLKTLKANGVTDPTIQDQIVRLYLDAIPERSLLQGFRNRKGTSGARKDAVLALKNKGMGIVRQLAQIEYGREYQAFKDEIEERFKKINSDPTKNAEKDTYALFYDDLNKRANFAASPNISNWSKYGSSIGFNFTLGFNASAALINLTALPMIVYPYLAGKYGFKYANAAMGNAIKTFASSGGQRMIETYGPDGTGKVKRVSGALWSLDNYNFDAKDTPPEIKMRRKLAEVAAEQGMLNRSITQDVLDLEGMDNSVGSKLQKINFYSGFMFHHMERAQRQVTLDAAYQLELSKRTGVPVNDLGKAFKDGKISDAVMEAAAREAVYTTELTNGGVAAAGAPRIAQNNIGRIAFMFKRYGVSMYYLLWQLTNKSVKGSPEDMKMARRQLAGVFGATGLLAGVGGMPLFGTLAMLANMFLGDDEEDFQTMTRQALGEATYGGLGNYLFGVDISARIGLSELIFRSNRIAKDQSVFFTAIEELGGPVVGIGMSAERGLNQIAEGDVTRGLETMLPSSIRNVMKGIRFATEGAKTLRGDSVVEDIGVGHSLGQMLGFAPAEYSRQLMENAALKKIDRAVANERTKILRRLYVSVRNGDSDGVQGMVERLRNFNRRHPSAAITVDSIQRSMRSHMRTSAQMHHGITLNKNMRAALEEEAREFDKNVSIWD